MSDWFNQGGFNQGDGFPAGEYWNALLQALSATGGNMIGSYCRHGKRRQTGGERIGSRLQNIDQATTIAAAMVLDQGAVKAYSEELQAPAGVV